MLMHTVDSCFLRMLASGCGPVPQLLGYHSCIGLEVTVTLQITLCNWVVLQSKSQCNRGMACNMTQHNRAELAGTTQIKANPPPHTGAQGVDRRPGPLIKPDAPGHSLRALWVVQFHTRLQKICLLRLFVANTEQVLESGATTTFTADTTATGCQARSRHSEKCPGS